MHDLPELVLQLLLDSPLLRPSSAVSLLHASPLLWRLSTTSHGDTSDGSHDSDAHRMWRRRLILDFPWFVYDGLCEGHHRGCSAQHPLIPPHCFPPRHRLPDSPRLAHLKIVKGGISLVCQVINSETPLERMQSVCFALVTFLPCSPAVTNNSDSLITATESTSTDNALPNAIHGIPDSEPLSPPWQQDDCFLVNYDPEWIARSAFHPVRVSSSHTHPIIPNIDLASLHECFTVVSAAKQFRRVPEEFVFASYDPRELWFRGIWERRARCMAPVENKGDRGTHAGIPQPSNASTNDPDPAINPFIYPVGTPVEVQWFQPSLFLRRGDQLDWWHGHILAHNPRNHSLVIEFRQYASETDIYRRVVADDRGMLREGVSGMCGGVREVRCAREIWKWQLNFQKLERGGGEVPPGMGVDWDAAPDSDEEEEMEMPANEAAVAFNGLAELLELAIQNPAVHAVLQQGGEQAIQQVLQGLAAQNGGGDAGDEEGNLVEMETDGETGPQGEE